MRYVWVDCSTIPAEEFDVEVLDLEAVEVELDYIEPDYKEVKRTLSLAFEARRLTDVYI